MASTNVDVIISAKDNASGTIRDVAGTAKSAGNSMSESLKAGAVAATGFAAALTGVGIAAVSIASNFEQNRISFETMLGSAEKGRKALAQLSDFAVKTPFELPQLITASKSLLAYGIEADSLIPTLRNLGDIASGVGMDKLPNLILAFGQVKAATKLTGMELRQFTEAGVPMLQALVDQANKAGGSWQMVGGSAKKVKGDVQGMNESLAEARLRLSEAEASGKSKASTLLTLRNNIAQYERKLAGANATGGEAKRVWVENTMTVEKMKEAISDGAVTFDMVQKALQGMSGEGGKFFNLMEKQSKTFGGVMSNMRDQITRSLAEIAGIDIAAGGIIRDGSLFAVLKTGAEAALNALNVFTPKLVAFTQELLKNKDALTVIGGALLGVVALLVGGFLAAFGTGLVVLAEFMVIGGAVAVLIKKIGDALGGWSGIIEKVKTSFSNLFAAVTPGLNEFVKQVKQGFTNAMNINFGEGSGIGEVFAKVLPILKDLADVIGKALKPAFDQLSASFAAAKPMIDQLLQQLGPILINAIQLIGAAIVGLVLIFAGLFSGIVEGVAVALPFFIQMFTGLAEFINGILTLITGLFKGNWDMVIEGTKLTFKGIYDVIVGFFGMIIGAVVGFVKGVIDYFQALYDALVGHSIIPDLVKAALKWFNQMKDTITAVVKVMVDLVIGSFNFLKEKVEGVINAIRNIIDSFKPVFKIGIELPDISGAWNSLKSRAKELNIPGFQTGGIVPGPIGAPTLAMVHGGEEIKSVGIGGGAGGSGSSVHFEVYLGLYAGSETEKRNIARELYGALLQVAQSQNKSVREFMGG